MVFLWLLVLLVACYLAWYVYRYARKNKHITRKEADKMYYVRALKERRLYTNDEYEDELSRLRTELQRINHENDRLELEIRSHDTRYALFASGTSHTDKRPMSIREASTYKRQLQQESYRLFQQATGIESDIRMLVELIRDRKRA
jgi:hypothetical protein